MAAKRRYRWIWQAEGPEATLSAKITSIRREGWLARRFGNSPSLTTHLPDPVILGFVAANGHSGELRMPGAWAKGLAAGMQVVFRLSGDGVLAVERD